MRRFLSLFTMLMLCGVFAFAQNRVVTGTITDDKGAPVEGASIRVKGTRTGVSADAQGHFRISVPAGATLTISGVGVTVKEVAVGSQSEINVNVIRSGAPELTAVVVTAAGIRRSEKSLGYTISKVDPNVLLQKSEPDVLKGLSGKVAGVDIRQGEGTPGAATRIQIRGNSSFYGDNQPLIVVDGVPFSNDQVGSNTLSGSGAYGSGLSDLDPNDIASMSILKGSSAAALYGSRASNGVVIITTKSGSVSRNKKGTEVSAKSSVSFENISNLPEYQNSYGTGSYGNFSQANGSWGQQFGLGNIYSANGTILRKSPTGIDSVPAFSNYLAAYPELFVNGETVFKAFPNNVKSLFQTGLVLENSVGVSTGDERSSFSLTGSQLNHSGYVPNNTYTRTNISAGGSSKLSIGVNVRGNFSYSRSDQKGGLFAENQTGGGSGAPSSQFGRSLFLGRNWDVSLPYQDKQGNSINWTANSQYDNPLWAYLNNTSQTYSERVVAGMHFDFNINKWAKVDYNVGSNVNTLNRREVQEVSSRGIAGTLELDNYRIQEIESTLLLSLTPNIGGDFSFKSTIGANYNQQTVSDFSGNGGFLTKAGYIIRGLHTLSNFKSDDISVSDTYSRRRLFGVFADANFGYKNFAFITVTGRNDISSTLPINSRSYFYPSVSGSFVFSDALKINKGILDYGKIRAGYAKVGRDASPYNVNNVFVLYGSQYLGQPVGAVSSSSNSALLQPEFTKELELGTDLSFLKKRIELGFTWYNKKSNNLLASIATAPSTGYSGLYTNFGGISNKGVEIELTLRPVTTRNFSWEVKGVFTKNKNLVDYLVDGTTSINLGGGTTSITTRLEPGKPFGYLYGSYAARDSATGALLINPATGNLITSADNKYLGDPNPDYKMGITNTFQYKGIGLTVLFDMTKGGKLYSGTVQNELSRGATMDTYDRQTAFVIPGVYGDPNTEKALTPGGKTVQNVTVIPTNDLYFLGAGGSFFGNGPNEFSVFDATVYRIREVTLSYTLPKSIMKNSRVSGVTFSISGRNLWYFAPGFPKYSHFDPETSNFGNSSIQGLEFSAAPTTRRLGVNLNVTF